MNSKEIINKLLSVLPDSHTGSEDGNCWDWCWNELNDSAQDEVKEARKLANEFINGKQEIESIQSIFGIDVLIDNDLPEDVWYIMSKKTYEKAFAEVIKQYESRTKTERPND